jgi:hypothetical protein
MNKISKNPVIVQHAKKLNLTTSGDCVGQIKDFAKNRVHSLLLDSKVDNLEQLKVLVAKSLNLQIQFLFCDEDIERLTENYKSFFSFVGNRSALGRELKTEFLKNSTEGLLLQPNVPENCPFKFLAVIDARGERSNRAYFTAWHEIVHLLIEPNHDEFTTVRRAPTQEEIIKDPIEQLVDLIAGELAFYSRFFEAPILQSITQSDNLTFSGIESVRSKVAPSASLYAATLASLGYVTKPTLFLTLALGMKKGEERRLLQPTLDFGGVVLGPEEKLRIKSIIASSDARKKFVLQDNMRVPERSIIHRVFNSPIDAEKNAYENQNFWEASKQGSLPDLPLLVNAVRRGKFVYALITIASASTDAEDSDQEYI